MSRLDVLRKERPRSSFLRVTLLVLGLFVLYAWLSGDIEWRSFLTQRRLEVVLRLQCEGLQLKRPLVFVRADDIDSLVPLTHPLEKSLSISLSL